MFAARNSENRPLTVIQMHTLAGTLLEKVQATSFSEGINADPKVYHEWMEAVGKLLDDRFSLGFAEALREGSGRTRKLPETLGEAEQFLTHTATRTGYAVKQHGGEALKAAYKENPGMFVSALQEACEKSRRSLQTMVMSHSHAAQR